MLDVISPGDLLYRLHQSRSTELFMGFVEYMMVEKHPRNLEKLYGHTNTYPIHEMGESVLQFFHS